MNINIAGTTLNNINIADFTLSFKSVVKKRVHDDFSRATKRRVTTRNPAINICHPALRPSFENNLRYCWMVNKLNVEVIMREQTVTS